MDRTKRKLQNERYMLRELERLTGPHRDALLAATILHAQEDGTLEELRELLLEAERQMGKNEIAVS